MRMRCLLCVCGMVALVSAPAFAGLQEGVRIEANGEVIDVEIGHLVPCVLDWNEDGKKDLLVGQFKGGQIALYLNEGTDAAPVFGASTYLHAGAQLIHLSAG